MKYFSGTAAYRREIEIPAGLIGKNKRLHLDLGQVKYLAEVRLNGMDLGVLWKPPFRVDISQAAKPGKNMLEVKVTNLWPNRLIGDQFLPESQRITRTNDKTYTKKSPLLESGLLGPVSIRVVEGRRLEAEGAAATSHTRQPHRLQAGFIIITPLGVFYSADGSPSNPLQNPLQSIGSQVVNAPPSPKEDLYDEFQSLARSSRAMFPSLRGPREGRRLRGLGGLGCRLDPGCATALRRASGP